MTVPQHTDSNSFYLKRGVSLHFELQIHQSYNQEISWIKCCSRSRSTKQKIHCLWKIVILKISLPGYHGKLLLFTQKEMVLSSYTESLHCILPDSPTFQLPCVRSQGKNFGQDPISISTEPFNLPSYLSLLIVSPQIDSLHL